jgi:type II secretory ATPase GspE/PulE/Tfp pilus assembly ATPase PilB-like protein
MSKEHRFRDGQAVVTLGLMDRRSQVGHLGRFRPEDGDLMLMAGSKGSGPAGGERSRRFATESIAFVAVHRGHTVPVPLPFETALLKVHVAGGQAFTVKVLKDETGDPLGFWGLPLLDSDSFGEIFFYQHGVNAREDKTTLGDILVDTGVIDREALVSGLETLANERATKIGDILVEQNKIGAEELAAAAAGQRAGATGPRRLKLGEILLEAGLVNDADITAALEEQKSRHGKRIGEVLVEMALVTEDDLAKALARKFNLPFVDLDPLPPCREALALIQPDFMSRYRMLPIAVDGDQLTVAVADPMSFEGVDLLRFSTGKRIAEVVATPSQIARRIDQLGKAAPAADSAKMEQILSSIQADTEDESAPDLRDLSLARQDDSGISKLVNQIIFDAQARGASDIHIEPDGPRLDTVVRLRIDGVCEVYRTFQPALRARLVSRIKILANMDITERRKPQDGKITLMIKDRPLELRVATIPTVSHDEDVVMRLFTASEAPDLERLDFSPRNLAELRRLVQAPYGLILAVGPTGSGKTTTLHALLGAINVPSRKIWTAEDPVEIVQRGLRQVQVQPKIGFTFANAMRSFLRADPDVIMVGEMRDQETAGTGIEASLTGHLVFSTLHTNTAPETITRFVDMGFDPFTFSEALLAVAAQRLARRLCPACRTEYLASRAEREELERHYGQEALARLLADRPLRLFRSTGCRECGQKGFKGRVALHELLVVDDPIRLAIQRRSPAAEIRALATRGGMLTLLQDGIEKSLAGHTDLRQVLAVCSR